MGGLGQRDCLLVILACFLPPLAMFIKCRQQCVNPVLISLVLTLLGFLPGVIYSIWWIVSHKNVVAAALGM